MRHLNVDWSQVAGALDTWSALSLDARKTFVEMHPNKLISRSAFAEPDAKLLHKADLITPGSDPSRVRLAGSVQAKALATAMRAMHRHPFGPGSTERDLADYGSDHLTNEERAALLHRGPTRDTTFGYSSYGSNHDFHLAADAAWVDDFLKLPDAATARKWEKAHLPQPRMGARYNDEQPMLVGEPLLAVTQALVAAAKTWPEAIPLAELPKHVPDFAPASVWWALFPAIRYLLIFPWLTRETMEPVVGLWPPLTHMLHRPSPEPVRPARPTDTFHAPLLIEDMQAVLVAAAAEPLRIKANGNGLYQKDQQRVSEAIVKLPGWLEPQFDDESRRLMSGVGTIATDYRLNDAIRSCESLGLLTPNEDESGKLRLTQTSKGRDWLGADLPQRIRASVAPWRPQPKPADKAGRKAKRRTSLMLLIDDQIRSYDDDLSAQPWLPTSFRYRLSPDEVERIDWRAAFTHMLARDDDAFVSITDLLEYHARQHNPLLGAYGPRPKLRPAYGFGSWSAQREPNQRELEDTWFNAASLTLLQDLLPLGAIELGYDDEQDHILIRLHDIGRYMLGLTDDFAYATRPEGDVIIQPNFEVVFLGSAPAAEAAIARLAERTGKRVGTMFRITKPAILAAAAAGVKADDAVTDLQRISSKPLPPNVEREVRGWFAGTRHARLRKAVLVDTPDPETTARILAAANSGGSGKARQLTPTTVEITVNGSHTTLIRKLRQAGIFVSESR